MNERATLLAPGEYFAFVNDLYLVHATRTGLTFITNEKAGHKMVTLRDYELHLLAELVAGLADGESLFTVLLDTVVKNGWDA